MVRSCECGYMKAKEGHPRYGGWPFCCGVLVRRGRLAHGLAARAGAAGATLG